METERWIPIAQYSVEEGVSISTIRRKIKSNALDHKMDAGRYLIRSEKSMRAVDAEKNGSRRDGAEVFSVQSSDANLKSSSDTLREVRALSGAIAQRVASAAPIRSVELRELEMKLMALDARLNGLAKKLEFLMEQNSEVNMLVKVFEEKLNAAF